MQNIETHVITMKVTVIREVDGNPAKWDWQAMTDIDLSHDECGITVTDTELVESFTVNDD